MLGTYISNPHITEQPLTSNGVNGGHETLDYTKPIIYDLQEFEPKQINLEETIN